MDREHAVNTLNQIRQGKINYKIIDEVLTDYCLEKGVDSEKINRFLEATKLPSMQMSLMQCFKMVLEHYEIKFNICNLSIGPTVLFYY